MKKVWRNTVQCARSKLRFTPRTHSIVYSKQYWRALFEVYEAANCNQRFYFLKIGDAKSSASWPATHCFLAIHVFKTTFLQIRIRSETARLLNNMVESTTTDNRLCNENFRTWIIQRKHQIETRTILQHTLLCNFPSHFVLFSAQNTSLWILSWCKAVA